jgi:ketosteroid isomerase-like protein
MNGDDIVSLMNRAYQVYRSGDDSALREVFTEDVTWHTNGIDGGPYQGVARVLEYVSVILRKWLTKDTFDIDVQSVVAHGSFGVGLHTAIGTRKDGRTLNDQVILVAHVAGQQFDEVWQFFGDPQAVHDFWS